MYTAFIPIAGLILVFGFYLMKRLDLFLDHNQTSLTICTESPMLRIAFENPSVIESISTLLEDFSKEHPTCEIHLFSGTTEDILKMLSKHEIDFCFVTMESKKELPVDWISVIIPLQQGCVISEAVNLPVMPIPMTDNKLKVLWIETDSNCQETKIFAKQLMHISSNYG